MNKNEQLAKEAEALVLEALSNSPLTAQEIAEYTGLGERRCYRTLNRLSDKGMVTKQGERFCRNLPSAGNGEAGSDGEGPKQNPEDCFGEGFYDVSGRWPDAAYVRKTVRRLLGANGFSPWATAVSEKAATALYLEGQDAGAAFLRECEETARRREEETARARATVPVQAHQVHQEACREATMHQRQMEMVIRVAHWLEKLGETWAEYNLMHLAPPWVGKDEAEIDKKDIPIWLELGKNYLRRQGRQVNKPTSLIKQDDPPPEPPRPDPVATVFDMVIRQKLATAIASQLSAFLPATVRTEEDSSFDGKVNELLETGRRHGWIK